MGKVYSLDQLKKGEIARSDGWSQTMAGRAIFHTLKEFNSSHFAVAFQGYGSAFAGRKGLGNAGRRGDADMIVGYARLDDNGQYVRSRSEEEVVGQEVFAESLRTMIKMQAARYHVHSEAHVISLVDAQEGVSELTADPLFLDHIAKAPDMWRLGDPLQRLREHAIDIEKPLTEQQSACIAATALRYMTFRAKYFVGALQHLEEDPSLTDLQLETLQRALEFAKAAARKTMAMTAVEGLYLGKGDVTSRESMYGQFQVLTQRVDRDGTMAASHSQVVRLNGEYDEILERSIEKKTTDEYETWLKTKIVDALRAAYQLAASCHRYVDRVMWDKAIVLDDFHDDEAYRLVSLDDDVGEPTATSSAPLSGAHLL